MKKTFKKSVSLLIVLVMLLTTLLIAPIGASAADAPTSLESSGLNIWADPENVLSQEAITDFNAGNTLATLGGIRPYKITASGAGALIYYLFLPSTADLSALTFWFEGTVTIDDTEIISGQPTDIFADINAGGTAASAMFNINGKSYGVIVLKSGEVGTVYIDTQSGSLSTITNSDDHSTSESGTIMVVQPDGTVDYVGVMDKMSGRGNGTWSKSNTKNPYNIKLAKSTSLLGMNAAKKWCLLANVNDDSLVKNQLTYDFAKYIGINYQPTCKPVDLYVNQQYLGSYQLAEKVEIKSNRIDVTDAYENLEIANGTVDPETGALIPADLTGTAITTYNPNRTGTNSTNLPDHSVSAKRYSPSLTEPSDYTGGYLYELEISNRWVTENAGFCAFNRQGWVIKSADYASTNMVDYSYNLLYALGASLYNRGTVPSTSITTSCSRLTLTTIYGASSITNPAPATQYQGMKWSDLLDADSAVRYYWTQEFFKNMDSSTSSTYFYKDSDSIDSKLYAGPMWDMDNSIGYGQSGKRWGCTWTDATDWYTKNTRIYRWRSKDSGTDYSSDNQAPLTFYGALATNCSDFWTMAEKYWYTYIKPAVEIIMGNAVDETGTLKSAQEYIKTVEKSGIMNATRFNGPFDADSLISSMTSWFDERTQWIDSQIPRTDISTASLSTVPNQYYTGEEITPSINVTRFISGQGTVTLEEGLDYKLTYDNNIDVGTATITVNGIGTYSGSVSKNFTIIPSNISNATLTIADEAYVNTELSAVLTDVNGKTIQKSVNYQWYRNNSPIDDATSSSYITTADDAGTELTVVATGDGNNLTGSVTSNVCTVLEGERPSGYTKTIASWDYDFTLDSEALVTADPTGAEYYYGATSGENQSSANLYASVNAKDNAKIKWSGSADLYNNDSNTVVSDQAPVMGTSKSDSLAWGEYPYFEAVVSTAGFEDIKFSAKLGGTKKAPRDWKFQYSLNGTDYTDIPDASYSILKNKTMELAFDDIALPAECNNQLTVYFRMVVTSDIAINGTDKIVNQLSGDAAVNNIKVTGASLSIVTDLYAPTITGINPVYDDSEIVITDNNGGADVFYTVDSGEPTLYTGPFNPFNPKTAKVGDTVTINAYAQFEDIVSPTVSEIFTFGGVDITNFIYDTYSTDVTGGAVASTGGVYDESGRMTAYTDGKSQYVPLWRDDNGSFCIAPDDGAKWSSDSGFTYKVSTAGYENINFSCKAYTTNSGPKSVTLQYSTDGTNFIDVKTNVALNANGTLEQAFLTTKLPKACENLAVLYIRLATTENSTFSGQTLHNKESKGNLYVNNVIIAGEDDGTYKMPYTNKSTNYFGKNGVIEYYSPDNLPMQYAVIDSHDKIVQSGSYPQTGIKLSTVNGFRTDIQEAYTILISVIEDEDSSLINRRTYYYKGETVVKFDYNNSSRPFADYVSSDNLSATNTSGANSGKLSMYPNASNPTTLSYTGTYGVKVAWDAANPFVASKKLDNPNNNGYWLIETSTLGYKNLTLNLEQLSSNKGPRDWGIAYSLDGKSYTYVKNSNVRAISNDASSDTIETYGNLPLPAECNNQETLYIKVFINGGEAVDGTELELVTKGNTGINAIEISGTPMTSIVTVKSTVLETPEATTGNIAFAGVNVYVNGKLMGTTNAQGELAIELENNKSYEITLGGDGIVDRTITKQISADETISAPVLVFDVNSDGYVNAKDYAMISKDSKYDGVKQFFQNFINCKTSEFTYK